MRSNERAQELAQGMLQMQRQRGGRQRRQGLRTMPRCVGAAGFRASTSNPLTPAALAPQASSNPLTPAALAPRASSNPLTPAALAPQASSCDDGPRRRRTINKLRESARANSDSDGSKKRRSNFDDGGPAKRGAAGRTRPRAEAYLYVNVGLTDISSLNPRVVSKRWVLFREYMYLMYFSQNPLCRWSSRGEGCGDERYRGESAEERTYGLRRVETKILDIVASH